MPEPGRFVQRTKMPSPKGPSQRIAGDQVTSDLGVSEGARTLAQPAGPNGTVGPAFDRHDQLAQLYIFLTPSSGSSTRWVGSASRCSHRHCIKVDTRKWGTWAREI